MANDKIEVGGVPKSSNEYETWISQGRTFDSSTGKWYEKATTPTTTSTNNTSYLSNLLNVAGDRGLDVSQILTNPNYVPPATPVEKYDYSAATSSANVLAEQLKSIQAQKDEAAKKLSEAGKENATDMASLISSYKPQTIDITGATETAEAKYGTDDLLAKLQTQNVKVASLQGELQKLETEELTAIDTAEGRIASRGAIEGEKDTITRAYNIKKAYKSAELYAEAAVAQAYSSNYTEAQKLVTRAVDAYTTEIKQEIENYNNLFSLQSDWIQTLDKKEQNLLQSKYDELVQKEKDVTSEKTEVLDLMIQYPNAGISIKDSVTEAGMKVVLYQKQHPEVKNAQLRYITDDSGNVKVYDESSGTPVLIKELGKVGQGSPQVGIAANATQSTYLSNMGSDQKVSWEGYYKMYNTFKQNGGGSLENFYALYPMSALMDSGNQAEWNKFASSNKIDTSSKLLTIPTK